MKASNISNELVLALWVFNFEVKLSIMNFNSSNLFVSEEVFGIKKGRQPMIATFEIL